MPFNRPIANPIFTREYRARWRNGLSSVLMFCYALFLAIAAGLVYASASFSARDTVLLHQMANTGHDLFATLSAMQIGAWLLLAPALTATSISSERERGLLEMLLLTPLSARRICMGKMLSVWGFVVLLMFAPLPITSLCFLLGGVSPAEFCVALTLQITSAIFGLSIGIWASAWSRRSTTAMTLAFGVVIAWGFLTILSLMAHEMRSPWVNASANSSGWQSFFLDGVWRTNPLFVFLIETADRRIAGGSWFSLYTPFDYPDWVFCGALQIVISLTLLMSATRALWKPLHEESSTRAAMQSHREHELAESEAANATTGTLSANSMARSIFSSQQQQIDSEIGILTNFRSSNPVMEREVRRWGRAQRVSAVASRWGRMGFLLAVGGYLLGVGYTLLDFEERAVTFFWFTTIAGLTLGSCLACALGAVSFTREHEAGTWENLQLSLLSPHQILVGKFVPACLLCATFCVVIWLPALICIDSGVASPSTPALYSHLDFSEWLFTLMMAQGTVWLCLCLGTMISALTTRIWMSVSWTIGAALFFYLVLPLFSVMLLTTFQIYSPHTRGVWIDFFSLWHPLFSLFKISVFGQYSSAPYLVTLRFLLVTFGLGSLMLIMAQRRLRRTLQGS